MNSDLFQILNLFFFFFFFFFRVNNNHLLIAYIYSYIYNNARKEKKDKKVQNKSDAHTNNASICSVGAQCSPF